MFSDDEEEKEFFGYMTDPNLFKGHVDENEIEQ